MIVLSKLKTFVAVSCILLYKGINIELIPSMNSNRFTMQHTKISKLLIE